MVQVFSKVLEMSLTASAVIGVVLVLRLLLKRAPKVWSYALWSVVLFRLLCPAGFETGLVLPRREVRVEVTEQTLERFEAMEPGQLGEIAYHAVGDALNGGLGTIPIRVEPEYAQSHGGGAALMHPEVWLLLFSSLWPLGVVIMAGRGGLSMLLLKRKLRGAAYRGEGVYEAEELETAFVLGLLEPRIYLPAGLSDEERLCVLCHERHHIARLDHITRALAFAALCLHWFNPLVWLSFRLAGKDMEMSCDEAVMKKLGGEGRRAYSQSLLNLATGRRMSVGTPLAFGEGDTKGRIKNVLKWKKPKLWVTVLAMLVCAAAICACASDPVETPVEEPIVPGQEAVMPTTPEEPTEENDVPNRRGLAFSELEQGQTVYLNEDVVLAGESSRVEWRVTYARLGLTLQVGLRAHANGCEYVADVDGGNGMGVFEHVDPGVYTPFVRNMDMGYEFEPNATGVVNFDLMLEEDYFQNGTPWPETEEDSLVIPENAQIIGPLPGNISLMPDLYAAVLDHHRSDKSDENFCCASIVVLANELGTRMHPVTGGDLSTMDYFLWVLYQEYQFTENGIVHKGGAHIPTNITLAENGDGSWSVLNYWEPRDGSYYVEDIKAIFPGDSANDALDSQKYVLKQTQDCYAQALSYAKSDPAVTMDVDKVIEGLLDDICSSPMTSSNPKDYAAEHFVEYRELKFYGDYTREYCERHLKAYYEENSYGKGTIDAPEGEDLRERIMVMLLAELNP